MRKNSRMRTAEAIRKRVAHRRVEALLQGLAADAVEHDRAEHPFELA
jgi:hypothetical protein